MAYDGTYLLSANYGMGLHHAILKTVDSAASIAAANYISDGVARGLALGDPVLVVQVAALPNGAATGISPYAVSAVGTTGVTIIKTATA